MEGAKPKPTKATEDAQALARRMRMTAAVRQQPRGDSHQDGDSNRLLPNDQRTGLFSPKSRSVASVLPSPSGAPALRFEPGSASAFDRKRVASAPEGGNMRSVRLVTPGAGTGGSPSPSQMPSRIVAGAAGSATNDTSRPEGSIGHAIASQKTLLSATLSTRGVTQVVDERDTVYACLFCWCRRCDGGPPSQVCCAPVTRAAAVADRKRSVRGSRLLRLRNSESAGGGPGEDELDEDEAAASAEAGIVIASDCGCCYCCPATRWCCPGGRCGVWKCCGAHMRPRCPCAMEIMNEAPPTACWRRVAGPIDPDSVGKVRFDVLVALATIYTAFMTPFQAAFGGVEQLRWIEAITDLFFAVHVWVEFRTAYEDPQKPGELIISLPRIGTRYCNGWFWPDAVASIPFEIILLVLESLSGVSSSSDAASNVLRGLALLRVLRLLRVGRLWIIAKRLKVTAYVRLARLLFSFVLGAHIFACLFWSIPALEEAMGVYSDLPPEFPRGPQSWVEQHGLTRPGVGSRTQYTYSLYWSVATIVSVGYGDVHAVSVGEQAFSVFAMAAGAITYSVLFGSVATLLASLNAHEAKFRQKLDAVDAFMRELRLPKRLQQRVRAYHDFSFSRQIEGRALLEELPVTLQGEILDWAHRQMLLQCPVTASADSQFIQLLSLKLEQVIALPDEFILSAGDAATDIFWVKEGEVVILNASFEGADAAAAALWDGEEEQDEFELLLEQTAGRGHAADSKLAWDDPARLALPSAHRAVALLYGAASAHAGGEAGAAAGVNRGSVPRGSIARSGLHLLNAASSGGADGSGSSAASNSRRGVHSGAPSETYARRGSQGVASTRTIGPGVSFIGSDVGPPVRQGRGSLDQRGGGGGGGGPGGRSPQAPPRGMIPWASVGRPGEGANGVLMNGLGGVAGSSAAAGSHPFASGLVSGRATGMRRSSTGAGANAPTDNLGRFRALALTVFGFSGGNSGAGGSGGGATGGGGGGGGRGRAGTTGTSALAMALSPQSSAASPSGHALSSTGTRNHHHQHPFLAAMAGGSKRAVSNNRMFGTGTGAPASQASPIAVVTSQPQGGAAIAGGAHTGQEQNRDSKTQSQRTLPFGAAQNSAISRRAVQGQGGLDVGRVQAAMARRRRQSLARALDGAERAGAAAAAGISEHSGTGASTAAAAEAGGGLGDGLSGGHISHLGRAMGGEHMQSYEGDGVRQRRNRRASGTASGQRGDPRSSSSYDAPIVPFGRVGSASGVGVGRGSGAVGSGGIAAIKPAAGMLAAHSDGSDRDLQSGSSSRRQRLLTEKERSRRRRRTVMVAAIKMAGIGSRSTRLGARLGASAAAQSSGSAEHTGDGSPQVSALHVGRLYSLSPVVTDIAGSQQAESSRNPGPRRGHRQSAPDELRGAGRGDGLLALADVTEAAEEYSASRDPEPQSKSTEGTRAAEPVHSPPAPQRESSDKAVPADSASNGGGEGVGGARKHVQDGGAAGDSSDGYADGTLTSTGPSIASAAGILSPSDAVAAMYSGASRADSTSAIPAPPSAAVSTGSAAGSASRHTDAQSQNKLTRTGSSVDQQARLHDDRLSVAERRVLVQRARRGSALILKHPGQLPPSATAGHTVGRRSSSVFAGDRHIVGRQSQEATRLAAAAAAGGSRASAGSTTSQGWRSPSQGGTTPGAQLHAHGDGGGRASGSGDGVGWSAAGAQAWQAERPSQGAGETTNADGDYVGGDGNAGVAHPAGFLEDSSDGHLHMATESNMVLSWRAASSYFGDEACLSCTPRTAHATYRAGTAGSSALSTITRIASHSILAPPSASGPGAAAGSVLPDPSVALSAHDYGRLERLMQKLTRAPDAGLNDNDTSGDGQGGDGTVRANRQRDAARESLTSSSLPWPEELDVPESVPVRQSPTHKVSAMAASFCELYKIGTDQVSLLLDLFYEENVTMQLVAKQRLEAARVGAFYDDSAMVRRVMRYKEVFQAACDTEIHAQAMQEPGDVIGSHGDGDGGGGGGARGVLATVLSEDGSSESEMTGSRTDGRGSATSSGGDGSSMSDGDAATSWSDASVDADEDRLRQRRGGGGYGPQLHGSGSNGVSSGNDEHSDPQGADNDSSAVGVLGASRQHSRNRRVKDRQSSASSAGSLQSAVSENGKRRHRHGRSRSSDAARRSRQQDGSGRTGHERDRSSSAAANRDIMTGLVSKSRPAGGLIARSAIAGRSGIPRSGNNGAGAIAVPGAVPVAPARPTAISAGLRLPMRVASRRGFPATGAVDAGLGGSSVISANGRIGHHIAGGSGVDGTAISSTADGQDGFTGSLLSGGNAGGAAGVGGNNRGNGRERGSIRRANTFAGGPHSSFAGAVLAAAKAARSGTTTAPGGNGPSSGDASGGGSSSGGGGAGQGASNGSGRTSRNRHHRSESADSRTGLGVTSAKSFAVGPGHARRRAEAMGTPAAARAAAAVGGGGSSGGADSAASIRGAGQATSGSGPGGPGLSSLTLARFMSGAVHAEHKAMREKRGVAHQQLQQQKQTRFQDATTRSRRRKGGHRSGDKSGKSGRGRSRTTEPFRPPAIDVTGPGGTSRIESPPTRLPAPPPPSRGIHSQSMRSSSHATMTSTLNESHSSTNSTTSGSQWTDKKLSKRAQSAGPLAGHWTRGGRSPPPGTTGHGHGHAHNHHHGEDGGAGHRGLWRDDAERRRVIRAELFASRQGGRAPHTLQQTTSHSEQDSDSYTTATVGTGSGTMAGPGDSDAMILQKLLLQMGSDISSRFDAVQHQLHKQSSRLGALETLVGSVLKQVKAQGSRDNQAEQAGEAVDTKAV